jgi:integrase
LPDGRRRTRTDPLKSVVRHWALDAEAAVRRGEWADPQDGRITLEQLWEKWTRARVVEHATTAKNTSNWRMHVQPRWGRVKLGAITSWDVEAWVADMRREGVGATTLYQSVQLLRQMLSDAARHRMIPADPTAGIRIPTPPKHVDRFLTRAEYEALVAHLPTDRDKVMVALMALAGLRWGEVAGLHSHRVDLARGQVTIVEVMQRNRQVKGVPKSRAGQRIVPLVPELRTALEPFLAGGLLFSGVDYTNWRRRVFVPARDAAGLADPQPTPHDLRHSFGSWLAAANVSPTEIMALLGHSSLRATERYLHAGDGRFERAVTALLGS